MEITRLPDSVVGKRYRVCGEPENKNWTVREGREPWCEITVTEEAYSDGKPTGRLLVTSFGGEVWPAAWPSIFSCHPNAMTANGTVVTEKGRKLLENANAQSLQS
jgi:hypothetical protein